VEGLQQEMSTKAEPRYGVLFGRISPNFTHIDAWRGVPALDREAMAGVEPASDCVVVGYDSIREDGESTMRFFPHEHSKPATRRPGNTVPSTSPCSFHGRSVSVSHIVLKPQCNRNAIIR
jgi:hypothetical protein